jgi:hypothetical protein
VNKNEIGEELLMSLILENKMILLPALLTIANMVFEGSNPSLSARIKKYKKKAYIFKIMY